MNPTTENRTTETQDVHLAQIEKSVINQLAELFVERAAILEYDAGFPRYKAEHMAKTAIMKSLSDAINKKVRNPNE